MVSFTDIIRGEFEKKKKLSLGELYNAVSKNPDIALEPHKIKHRIRSTIFSLQQNNEIKRVKTETYEKIDSP